VAGAAAAISRRVFSISCGVFATHWSDREFVRSLTYDRPNGTAVHRGSFVSGSFTAPLSAVAADHKPGLSTARRSYSKAKLSCRASGRSAAEAIAYFGLQGRIANIANLVTLYGAALHVHNTNVARLRRIRQ
jgi:hypothetical protein